MESGIAFHHAGVPTQALQQIEWLAARSLLRFVCATTTVAKGADLPFRVVVIPHLNFPSPSRRLERDLYMNMIGRAGRANVAVEGIVFVLDSPAPTLRNVVRGSLWSTSAADRVRGRLEEVDVIPRNLEELNAFAEVQAQVLGWLGDGDSYVDDQASVLGSLTFTSFAGNQADRNHVTGLLEHALVGLETDGYALAASPYRLTHKGRRARLTGLMSASFNRIDTALEDSPWLEDLPANELDDVTAERIARLLFEAIEVVEHDSLDPTDKRRTCQTASRPTTRRR